MPSTSGELGRTSLLDGGQALLQVVHGHRDRLRQSLPCQSRLERLRPAGPEGERRWEIYEVEGMENLETIEGDALPPI